MTGWTPIPHAATHQKDGRDKLNVSGLPGVLRDKQDAGKLQGRAVSTDAPANGEVLTWVASSSKWEPALAGGGAPAAHAASHKNGGADEISVAGLSGVLADAQTPATHTHAPGDVTGTAVVDADSRLTDARPPTPHGQSAHSGTIGTASQVGLPMITVGTSPPGSPVVDELWIDSN